MTVTVDDIVGPGITRVFEQMTICDEEIAKVDGASGAFSVCCPALAIKLDVMQRDNLYRAHCAELARRVANSQDTRPGTDAEILAVLSTASLSSPMRPVYNATYFYLFNKLFPNSGIESVDYGTSITGDQISEVVSEIRKFTTNSDRVTA